MTLKDYPVSNQKLGALYTNEETTFHIWAPTQNHLKIAHYETARGLHRTLYDMSKDSDGVFKVTIKGDLHGTFYTLITDDQSEITDPYAISTNTNGIRSAIVDLNQTNPEGWNTHEIPKGNTLCDAIIYEMHIKDFTSHKTSGIHHKGKFLGLTESGTQFKHYTTGLDHLVDLGITHVHLLPVYDYLTVDETDNSDTNYNWGYDPEHYNVPEGCYATNPEDPSVRIFELKKAIMALHEKGLKVVLDVVYNHTYRSHYSNFNVLVPGYYHRLTDDGNFSNGSGCGNEIASENPMVQKFIVESLKYWAQEYKVDGFRFDLMGLMDLKTVDVFMAELKKINPDILIYGEPWTGGLTTLPENQRVFKGAQIGKGYSLFNDDFRNALKGDNDGTEKGFIHGNKNSAHATLTGIVGSIPFDDHHIGFAGKAGESINYFNSHDNLILWDKILKSTENASFETLIRMNKLAFSILLTAQGIPFFHAGNEFLRDKKGHHNTYNASLKINAIDWENKAKHYGFYTYVRDLIALRKKYKCLRLSDAEAIKKRIHIIKDVSFSDLIKNGIVYTIDQDETEDFHRLMIVHNPSHTPMLLETHRILSYLCAQKYPDVPPAVHNVKIERIFDENGWFKDSKSLNPDHQNILKIDPISTHIFKLTNLEIDL